ncbi:hypothetical protein LTR91_017778 [Friedmanniomyces endolithicus]|uniref:Myb-like domain-containing protein n=1 Tax=Friedmanniomyces endolithicus TaxID=329885 RepID=A0A4U0UK17_9PEZI|nr:hypothetical protein LTS09_014425 [Friedmanniomyces endolithicus]KAK0274098.1 hypothetical protein LTR35_011891 [Friedmanniomyces endolithicus]KAK0293286.1 hypothetical protein LTS00_007532 [Friedmanniomyces endolithicus]KAK0304219.1 hypothetical protein LTR01_007575 [Friedmanniomyces endolithicus]KAK0306909.1 hypothetical protein LTR82_016236 [Friedmanniomyces endolithicus]
MGRLATQLAALATDAENLPPSEKLPNVSFIDALLPRRCADLGSPREDRKPLDPNIGRRTAVTYYDIKKDGKGKSSIIAHRSPAPSAHGGNGKEEEKNGKKGGNGEKVKNSGKNDANAEKKDVKKDGGGNNDKNPNFREWTTGEDAELKKLMAQGNTFKQIAKEMKRGQAQIKKHWAEIGNTAKVDQAEPKKTETRAEEPKHASKKEKKAAKKAAKKAEAEIHAAAAEKKDTKPDRRDGEARFTLHEWQTLTEDSLFSLGELQCLSELAMRDQSQNWLRVAAKFYDKTGRRVHPEDIREKFEEMCSFG